ncbi:MAG: LysR family transcriptional regulator [Victivallaceae bacterium]|nr:LysR family transcriptional regulator [Victivallaceae bacterium]
MNLLQLKYLREAVICGSVTLAARRLHITQPAVSKQLGLLAEELDCELWNRRRGKLRLTESGRVIFQRAELILEQLHLLEKELADLNAENEITGSLTVGCGPLLSRSLLPQLSVDFIRQYPKVHLSIYESDSIQLPGLLADGSIDIGLGAGNLKTDSKIKFTALLKDSYLVIHSAELVIPGSVFPTARLGDYPFINYMPGSTVLASVDKRLKLKKLNSILYARNTETVIEFVRRNAGIAFMPSYMFKLLRPEGIIAKCLDKPVYQNIGIYCLAENNNNPVYEIFTAKVRDAFRKLSQDAVV